MKIIGFGFEKIHAEKNIISKQEIKINTKIDIFSINKIPSGFDMGKNEIIKVNFSYIISYDPNLAKVDLEGYVLLLDEPKRIKEILNQWEEKKISDEFKLTVFNLVLKKSTLRALQLEEELNLPPHIATPSLKKQDKNE